MKVLSLGLIEQGRLLADIQEALETASEFLAGYIERHGTAAAGAKYALRA